MPIHISSAFDIFQKKRKKTREVMDDNEHISDLDPSVPKSEPNKKWKKLKKTMSSATAASKTAGESSAPSSSQRRPTKTRSYTAPPIRMSLFLVCSSRKCLPVHRLLNSSTGLARQHSPQRRRRRPLLSMLTMRLSAHRV